MHQMLLYNKVIFLIHFYPLASPALSDENCVLGALLKQHLRE